MDKQFIVGAVARIVLTVSNPAGPLMDPSALRFKFIRPDFVQVDHVLGAPESGIVRDGLGRYHIDIPLPLVGNWYWRWETGPVPVGVSEGSIAVMPSRFTLETQ